MQAMMRAVRLSVGAGAVALALFGIGFVHFANVTSREAAWSFQSADAIVVLTGGEKRIGEAARLLSEGKARRLLISGVNRLISKDDARRLTGLDDRRFDCCVDVGYGAQDTSGNADETRAWAASWGFSSLIVVTASYHMPRSLLEMSQAMPGVRLIPHPVVPNRFRTDRWWLHVDTARILVSEFVKYVRSAIRLQFGRPPASSAITWAASHPNSKT
jgi:uncharacterized SAM-binding protein YcdF (DUF218 family)